VKHHLVDASAIAGLVMVAVFALIFQKEHGHTIALAILPMIAQVAVVKRALYAPPPTDTRDRPTTIPPEPKSATGLMLAPLVLLASYFNLWRHP